MAKSWIAGYVAFIIIGSASMYSQVEGRFGFEYNEIGFWAAPHHQNLLNVLETTGAAGGDINVNSVGGGWYGMQPSQTDSIDFSDTDQIVTLFQNRGFALAWNLSPNAPWAFPNKPPCQPDTIGPLIIPKDCAPEPQFEQAWIDFITAVVERYDGDGIDDMPGLTIPARAYIMTGEVKFGSAGEGDTGAGPFWFDNIDNLLRLHRITYSAIHAADTSARVKVVSSGGLLTDLYADFPDYPEFDPQDPGSLIRQRLNGDNWSGNLFTAGWDSLKKMLLSFGNDADGIEADYIGWHPHMGWRVIDQEFALIRALAGDRPIYVDDMWTNVFTVGRGIFNQVIPGRLQFTAPPDPGTGTAWLTADYGDFPNPLFPGTDPHDELKQGLQARDPEVLAWYYGNGARELVKAFVSAFGEGAVIATYSGTNDLTELRGPAPVIGWLNLVGTRAENYGKKPQYYAFRQMVEKLHDFSDVNEIAAGTDPRTRVYQIERPMRGPIWVCWSETGDPPPGLDYRIATGETVTFNVSAQQLLQTRVISDSANTEPELDTLTASGGQLTIQLGHSPVYLESLPSMAVDPPAVGRPEGFALAQNYPNPFNPGTTIRFTIPRSADVSLKIYNLLGEEIATLVAARLSAGSYSILWEAKDIPGGVYFCRLSADAFSDTRKLILLH